MAYQKQTFIDNVTVLNASMLNHIEEGIYNVEQNISNKAELNSEGVIKSEHLPSGLLTQENLPAAINAALAQAKASGEFKGDPGDKGDTGKTAFEYAQDGGYVGTEEAFSEKLATSNSVKDFGAKGDGTTDDTQAFKDALEENRIVYVPSGTYKLSDTIRIGENSELELSQDTVLNFIQNDRNCIEMPRLSTLKGNHATINVPYDFNANVICASTEVDNGKGNLFPVEPFEQWTPQWAMSRYVTDINICKPDYRGFHYSVDGDCYGTALYIHAKSNFLWGVSMSGVRIAGGFVNGIHILNEKKDDGDYQWNHDMRIEAVIDACENGVVVENCNNAHLAVTFQPRRAFKTDNTTYIPYAKHGIKLVESKNIDLSSSCIWDWDEDHTLCSSNEEYQFLSIHGDCPSTILGAFQYHSKGGNIRDFIYTDTPDNFDSMIIIQEPITKWFKLIDNEPYYSDGYSEKKLATQAEIDALFGTTMVEKFTNQLPIATDKNGNIYNDIGYKLEAMCIDSEDSGEKYEKYSILTGYIPVKDESTVYFKGLKWTQNNGYYERIYFFDKNKNPLNDGTYNAFITAEHVNNGDNGKLYYKDYQTSDDGFLFTLGKNNLLNNVGYIRINFFKNDIVDANPVITVDEEIIYEQVGTLSDGIKVSAENVVGPAGANSITKALQDGDGNIITNTYATKEAVGDQISILSGQTMHYTVNASAIMDELSLFTNVLPYSLASGGRSLYSSTGYKVNTRFSTSGKTDILNDHTSITGFIPVKVGDVIRLKNISIPKTTAQTGMIHAFTDVTNESISATFSVAYFPSSMNVICGNDGSYIQFTIPEITPAIKFIRIQAFEFRQGATITINEPINNPNADYIPISGTYKNILRSAQQADSTNVYNTWGYATGKRISSSNPNNETAAEGMCVSGYIPYSEGEIIRIYKVTINGSASPRIAFYDDNKNSLSIPEFTQVFADIDGVYTYAHHDKKCKYFRLSIGDINDHTLITLDERFNPGEYDISIDGYLPGEPV